MTDTDPIPDFLQSQGPPVMRQTDRQTKPDQPAKAPARKRGGRPRKARGAATTTDKAAARWTVRGVPVNVREIATKAAENRGMTVGDWISEAVVAFSKADTNRVSADGANVPAPVDLVDGMKDMQARLTKLEDVQARVTKLEARDTRGLLGKLFGKSTMAALVLAVFLISGTAWAQTERRVLVLAPGQQSCGAWLAAKEEGTLKRQIFQVWANGYLTAYSQWEEKGSGPVSSLGDAMGAWTWIDNHCQDNPLDDVYQAAVKLIVAITEK